MKTCETIAPELDTGRKEVIVHLPLGLLGFESIKKYVLVSEPQDAPFHWLQMLEQDGLAFLLLSPFEVLPDYEMDLSDEDAVFLNIASPADALVLNIVTARPGRPATINLKGPVVLNRSSLIGKQVVLKNASRYSLNHPLTA